MLFNFGHNSRMGVFCLYVRYSTVCNSTRITSLVYLTLPQSLTHSFELELLEQKSDLRTVDKNYLVVCQPHTRTTNYILYTYIYIVDQPVFASALSFRPYPMPLLLFVTHIALLLYLAQYIIRVSLHLWHNRFLEQSKVQQLGQS